MLRSPFLLLTSVTLAAAPALADESRPAMARSDTCHELRDRMIDWAAWQYVTYRYGFHGLEGPSRAPSGAADRSAPSTEAKTADAGGASGPGSYTTTNVQERGVDEADLVKTDGKHVYTVNQHSVVIVKSWPVSEAGVIARLQLPEQVTPQQLYLRGDKLVVLSSVYEPVAASRAARRGLVRWWEGDWDARQSFYGTRISVVNIKDRGRPFIEHQTDLEGWMAQSRMVGNQLYLVGNNRLFIPRGLFDLADEIEDQLPPRSERHSTDARQQQDAMKTVRTHLARRWQGRSMDEVMPRTRTSYGRQMSGLEPLLSCREVHVPAGGAQLGLLTLSHIDLGTPWRVRTLGVFASGWQIYASTEALYVAMPEYGWDYFWGWWGPSGPPRQPNRTQVHKFRLRGESSSDPEYAASGFVRGHLLNQFSMSEHRGDLRVVTTDQGWWNGLAGESAAGNHLFVMRDRDGRLETVGSVKGLAPGERVFAARMIGDRGYVVTFRQTDPLFTLDLSDPEKPRVVGELKVNGFSSYIHPLGESRLLTIGQDADDSGRVQGLHLQIFDVSDARRPVRTAHHRLETGAGYSWSAAQWDHHAFTFDPRSGTLAFPYQSWSASQESFSGVVAFHVDPRGSFEELGRISHAGLARRHFESACRRGDPSYQYHCQAYDARTWLQSYAALTRSIVMDDHLFTLSNIGLQVNSLADPRRIEAALLLDGSDDRAPQRVHAVFVQ